MLSVCSPAHKTDSASAVLPKKVSKPIVLDVSPPGPETSASLHDDKYMYYVKSVHLLFICYTC